MKYALIDMGSNSIRLTVYDVDQTAFKILFREKIMAGLAGYVEHGRLSGDGIECACQSLREFRQTLDLLQIGNLAVFATASLRNISNTAQAVEQIFRATGIPVEVLSGEAEAEYGFQGATCDIRIADGLFADVGGASAELVLFGGGQVRKAASVPVGSLKLYRECVKKILPGKESRRRIEAAVRTAFEGDDLRDFPRRAHLVCVGGTARASLRLCRRLFGLPEDSRTFTRSQLEALDRQLRGTGKDTADLILRCEPERIHTLVPGVMVLRFLAERYGVEDITVSHYGVREGYLRRKIQPSVQA
ncbi:Ppx/GppA phosphatase family protein [Dysosmobacter sp.]|uniref:Ppx/GppA phosphatase family protein n=1 Tax=Dysosmobacter sp. TaxID=2591382 RepID=UPI002A98927D|nr:hypothetical protein [Dysosmobacter sp.]MDY5510062.1 hypothetical protein [Dysosmobacter sp.]